MSTPKYFLDTNVWFSLAKESQACLAKHLRMLTSKDRIHVLGSGELLEEFAGIGEKSEKRLAARLDLFWTCTNGQLFLPHSELVRAEVRKGSRLTLPEALLDRQIVSELRKRDWSEPIWREVAVGVGDQKADYAAKMARTNREFAEEVATFGTERETRKVSRELQIDKVQINSWFRSFCSANRSKLGLGENPETWPCGSALPAVSTQFAFYIALAKRAHAEGKKAEPADLHDTIHCAHAAYTDCLVTNDKRLRLTAQQIEWPKLPMITGDEFFDRISKIS